MITKTMKGVEEETFEEFKREFGAMYS